MRLCTLALRAFLAVAALSAAGGCASVDGTPPEGEAATGPAVSESDAEAEPEPPAPRPKGQAARVVRVIDGDTIEVSGGRRVRLVQIDAPETGGECYGAEASAALDGLLPAGARVRLERDPLLDGVDRYGRLLRYVHRGGTNVNLALVRRGAASVWFYEGDRGRYADRLLAAARKAKAAGRGAWGACRAELDPARAFETRHRGAGAPAAAAGAGCAAGYSPCLPAGPDLDCADVRALGKAPVRVTGSDPYRLDGDGDGWACE